MLRSSFHGEPVSNPVSKCAPSPAPESGFAGISMRNELEVDVHAKDGCTASHIQDDLVLEDVFVLVYRISV